MRMRTLLDMALACAPAGHGSAAPSVLHRRSNESRLLALARPHNHRVSAL